VAKISRNTAYQPLTPERKADKQKRKTDVRHCNGKETVAVQLQSCSRPMLRKENRPETADSDELSSSPQGRNLNRGVATQKGERQTAIIHVRKRKWRNPGTDPRMNGQPGER